MVYNMISYEAEQKLFVIAKESLGVKRFEVKNSDSLDFYDVSIWNIKEALIRAYLVGLDRGWDDAKNLISND